MEYNCWLYVWIEPFWIIFSTQNWFIYSENITGKKEISYDMDCNALSNILHIHYKWDVLRLRLSPSLTSDLFCLIFPKFKRKKKSKIKSVCSSCAMIFRKKTRPQIMCDLIPYEHVLILSERPFVGIFSPKRVLYVFVPYKILLFIRTWFL